MANRSIDKLMERESEPQSRCGHREDPRGTGSVDSRSPAGFRSARDSNSQDSNVLFIAFYREKLNGWHSSSRGSCQPRTRNLCRELDAQLACQSFVSKSFPHS